MEQEAAVRAERATCSRRAEWAQQHPLGPGGGRCPPGEHLSSAPRAPKLTECSARMVGGGGLSVPLPLQFLLQTEVNPPRGAGSNLSWKPPTHPPPACCPHPSPILSASPSPGSKPHKCLMPIEPQPGGALTPRTSCWPCHSPPLSSPFGQVSLVEDKASAALSIQDSQN